jgi:hypothetical protein
MAGGKEPRIRLDLELLQADHGSAGHQTVNLIAIRQSCGKSSGTTI